MADVIARREARRRKILENTECRLKKIAGVEDKKASIDLDGYRTPTSVETDTTRIESTETLFSSNSNFNSASDNSLPFSNHSLSNSSTIRELRSLLNNQDTFTVPNDEFLITNNESVNVENQPKSINIVIYLAFVALISTFSSVCFIDNVPFVNHVFVPFLCFEVVKFTLLKGDFGISHSSSVTTLTSLILFSNRRINRNTHAKIIKGLGVLTVILQDISVYFFAYVCFYYLFKFILL